MSNITIDKKEINTLVCYIHPQKSAIGACVGCGKFICSECSTQIKNKNYCKPCVNELFSETEKKVDKLENKSHQPNVFMNAGGASSSSSSSTGNSNLPNKNRITAVLLAMFLGGLGIHKFYLNKSALGIIYLLFCWTFILAVIGFIEGIIYLVTTDNDFARKYG